VVFDLDLKLGGIMFFIAALFSLALCSTTFATDIEMYDRNTQTNTWVSPQPLVNQQEVYLQNEDDRFSVIRIAKALGGNVTCGVVAASTTVIGGTVGMLYLYSEYPGISLGTVLSISAPLYVGATLGGIIGCGAGYFIKRHIEPTAQ
jgi:uncharacterized membrane protein SpoIIM required for sporulation